MLSEEQAEWLKEIAVSFSDSLLSDINIYTPSLLNQTLKNLNTTPSTPSYESLVKAFNTARPQTRTLQAYQE